MSPAGFKVTMHRPSGFSDVPYIERPVTIVGYVYGSHIDGGGYNRRRECALAVYIDEGGRMDAAPVHWFRVDSKDRAS